MNQSTERKEHMRKLNAICFWFCFVILTGFVISNPIALKAGEDGLDEETLQKDPEAANLKDRGRFNQLKRSTRNIYKVTMRSTVAFKLQTALGFVSTIDLPEKALKVFVGDQELFKVEVYERQVLVKPITDELAARTNLIIITRTARLSFDVSVGVPETADFVLDFRLPQNDETLVKNAFEEKIEEKKAVLETEFKKKEEQLDEKASALSEEKIKERVASGLKTIELRKSEAKDEIQVNLLTLAQVADKAYLRFSILNYSKTPYRISKVSLFIQTFEKRLIGKRESSLIEIPSALKFASAIKPDSYEYGVLEFEARALGKDEKPVFKISEETLASSDGQSNGRGIEIKGFGWFK
jgi:type IV secretory pathway VirB9-like protein